MTERALIHTRTIRMEAVRVSDREMEVTGHLVDERPEPEDWFGVPSGLVIHDMSVTLRVRTPDLVVTAASAAMDARPYTICTDALDPLQSLVGRRSRVASRGRSTSAWGGPAAAPTSPPSSTRSRPSSARAPASPSGGRARSRTRRPTCGS
jgi:hypothetical protein